MIAVTHPGKIGDALYALPVIRWLCAKHECQADFYTSEFCRPMLRLMERQSCIRHARISEGYVPTRADIGVQPWEMPVPDLGYKEVFHLGFRGEFHVFIRDYIAHLVGAPNGLAHYFEFDAAEPPIPGDYAVMAPRGDTTYRDAFEGMIARSPIPVIQVGATGEAIAGGIDMTGTDLLDTLPIIAGAKAFYGLMSSNLVLANALPVLRISPHDNRSWNLSHAVHSWLNHYPVLPSADTLLSYITPPDSYCRTLGHNDYYNLSIDVAKVDETMIRLGHGNFQFNHPHRRWEYGLAAQAVRLGRSKTVLDVGGGGSPFAFTCAANGADVTQIDPCDFTDWVKSQGDRLGLRVDFMPTSLEDWASTETYDAVCALSVIEHVPDDMAFFRHMTARVKPGGVLVLTTDFHPSGHPQCGSHLRTYNEESLLRLTKSDAEFEIWGDQPRWTDNGPQVHGYNFAALVLRRRP